MTMTKSIAKKVPPSSPRGDQQSSTQEQVTNPSFAPMPCTYSPADNFKKSIKRDKTPLPTLKDERCQDSWQQNFENQCRIQDMEDLISVTPKPTDPALLAVFELKQKWLHAMLFDKCRPHEARQSCASIVNRPMHRLAYAKLVSHDTQSVGADISASAIENCITTTKFGNGKFRGSSSAFITHFVNQMELL